MRPKRRIIINSNSGPSNSDLNARKNAQRALGRVVLMKQGPQQLISIKGAGQRRMPGEAPFRRTFQIEFVAGTTEDEAEPGRVQQRDSVPSPDRKGLTGTVQLSGGDDTNLNEITDQEFEANDCSEDRT